MEWKLVSNDSKKIIFTTTTKTTFSFATTTKITFLICNTNNNNVFHLHNNQNKLFYLQHQPKQFFYLQQHQPKQLFKSARASSLGLRRRLAPWPSTSRTWRPPKSWWRPTRSSPSDSSRIRNQKKQNNFWRRQQVFTTIFFQRLRATNFSFRYSWKSCYFT